MGKPIKHGLGRGLEALLGAQESEHTEKGNAAERVISVKIGLIDPNREQPRRRFDEQALERLTESIRSVGVIQPILVREKAGRYQIIAGERRWRAARMAGLSEIPAIVRDWEESVRLEVALIENLQRDDLNPVEQANGIKNLMEQCGYTQEAAAERLGMSRPAVANLLRLLSLPEAVRRMLADLRLSAGHARALAALTDEELQVRLAERAARQGLSVRQMEQLVKDSALPKAFAPPEEEAASRDPDPARKQLERMAEGVFGTRARLEGDADRGRLMLHYYSADDLQRIWEILELMEQGGQ